MLLLCNTVFMLLLCSRIIAHVRRHFVLVVATQCLCCCYVRVLLLTCGRRHFVLVMATQMWCFHHKIARFHHKTGQNVVEIPQNVVFMHLSSRFIHRPWFWRPTQQFFFILHSRYRAQIHLTIPYLAPGLNDRVPFLGQICKHVFRI